MINFLKAAPVVFLIGTMVTAILYQKTLVRNLADDCHYLWNHGLSFYHAMGGSIYLQFYHA